MSCQGITGKQNFVDNSLVLISKLINNCVMFIPCHFCAKYLLTLTMSTKQYLMLELNLVCWFHS